MTLLPTTRDRTKGVDNIYEQAAADRNPIVRYAYLMVDDSIVFLKQQAYPVILVCPGRVLLTFSRTCRFYFVLLNNKRDG